MTTAVIAEDIRIRLAQSMPVIERNRHQILLELQDRLVAQETPEEPFGQGDVTAVTLLGLLIECAGDLAAFGRPRDLHRAASKHRRLDIEGRHYARFGNALAPVLRKVLGTRLSPKMVNAWYESYLFLLHLMGIRIEQLMPHPVRR
ncbi:globin domain-containing protein [Sphingosinicella sp. YJ22]|uniref:globin domain-containing protein n=1 Tax=Sphingosinicella sp. YJ22 TaxID=1104780 RepID=UPI00140AA1FC|nr:globin domain-containing protein [Sphingosinicella sp. YJ22]